MESDVARPSVTAAVQNTDIAQLIQDAVQHALDQKLADQQAASAPRVQTPEEAARADLDNAGAGLGIEERFAQIYKHLSLLASKVGI